MDKYVVLKKADFNPFIKTLAAKNKVVAPVAKGYNNFAFSEVTSADEISLKYIPTILPPKKYLMPQSEKIEEFDKAAKKWTPVSGGDALVLFGVHTCDLAGMQFLNKVMGTDPKDVNYLSRSQKVTLVGLECGDYCDSYASCAVVKNHLPSGGYDLFFTELKDIFMVHVATDKGNALVEQAKVFAPATDQDQKVLADYRKKKETLFKSEVNVKTEGLRPLFNNKEESPVWEDLNARCISCGNCTNVCPTCYCFDIRDELDLNLNTGIRYRVWDGCQSENFARVAGGENFREERGARQRHRYYRKFRFPVDRFGTFACTGCGRCSRTCMAKINLKETINALAEEGK